MSPFRIRSLGTALLALSALACDDAPTGPTATLSPRAFDLSQEWETALPADVGFDVARLDQALSQATGLRSLVIARNGYLIHESYGGTITRDSLHDVRSVTKSIMSALVGIALRDGLLPGAAQRLDELLPPGIVPDSEAKRAIRLEHLLTMTAGFDWHENGPIGYNEWVTSGDPVRYLLDRPLSEPPGTSFNYNSAAVHLISVILAHVAGEPLPVWAARVFFDHLGVERVAWEPMSGGHVNGGSGIDLRAIDLARIGQLYLQGGASGVRQVLPGDWVAATIEPRFGSFGFNEGIESPNYGLLWWLELADPPAFFAWGYAGQFVYVVPSRHLVIVLTTEWRGAGPTAATNGTRALQLIGRIVDAAR
jgi:CubicO group peptidase (beta-lactamase class C family)